MSKNDSILDQLAENQEEQSRRNMAVHTLVGNLTNWRTNFKNANHKQTVYRGYNKIMSFIARGIQD